MKASPEQTSGGDWNLTSGTQETFDLWMSLIKTVYTNTVSVCTFFSLMGLLENVHIHLVVWVFMLFIK